MTEPTDRFKIEIGTGTVAHIIDMDTDQAETGSRFSLGFGGPGEKMCSRGHRHPGDQQVPLPEFMTHHDIEKEGFEGDAPTEICSYCWSNTCEEVAQDQARDTGDRSAKTSSAGYRLRWKQKGRAREEWYDIVVRPETTVAELDKLVCRFSTLDDFHLRMYGLEDEYLDSSINVVPDHQHSNPSDILASEMRVAEVAEQSDLWEGDRLSLVYDFGTPSHYYCIVKEVYESAELDSLLASTDFIAETDTAAIVDQKRP
jgi:hypothetical protein